MSVPTRPACPQPGGPPGAWFDLIAHADALLYEAKRTGRNRVVSPANIEGNGAAPLPDAEAARPSGRQPTSKPVPPEAPPHPT